MNSSKSSIWRFSTGSGFEPGASASVTIRCSSAAGSSCTCHPRHRSQRRRRVPELRGVVSRTARSLDPQCPGHPQHGLDSRVRNVTSHFVRRVAERVRRLP